VRQDSFQYIYLIRAQIAWSAGINLTRAADLATAALLASSSVTLVQRQISARLAFRAGLQSARDLQVALCAVLVNTLLQKRVAALHVAREDSNRTLAPSYA
jgi:hypothetical protein